jgi:L-ribulose-5-phosphate 4-epimerase
MALEMLRQEVWKCNLELPKNGLVKMTSGNVSGRDPETNLVVIKPSGYSYEDLTPADMVIVNMEGEVLEGHLKPSVDTATHLYIYQHRPDVFGVVHTHSPYASSFAALGQSIPACLTTTAMLGGEIPIGKYVPAVGTKAIGEEVVRCIGHSLAIVMQNHGVFTIGKSARQATKIAVEVEEIAHITHLALLRGQPILLTQEQIAEVSDIYTYTYGQR